MPWWGVLITVVVAVVMLVFIIVSAVALGSFQRTQKHVDNVFDRGRGTSPRSTWRHDRWT